ncbi:YaaA family protein [Flexivirga caeni]|uniref:Peroxide stress protein YaaA n=1 Tax=Flexivirga caeni TaxID=2294115 RepID=A0A3M9LZW9_9MICO|nr:peroxide stress protein YaaA [Flexivirga caeni]RNI17898.1 peroxide stress protein YaaA [Flexivirga caeni]
MLILLPPSETKTPRRRGAPLDLDTVSFPELTPARDRVIDVLAAASTRTDALEVLGVGASLAADVARNVTLRTAPAGPVESLYTGVLYDALDLPGLAGVALRRARRWIVVQSALFGALRLTDKVPGYRLSMGTNLPGVGPLAAHWRAELASPLTEFAGSGVIVDCRSSTYAAAWTPAGASAARWVRIHVPGATHNAKHTRGLVTRHLAVAGATPRTPQALRDVVGAAFDVALTEPRRASAPWELAVTAR